MQRRGFTLVELLTVVAIVAVLAAILFPVFSRARVSAHQAVWVNQHRQAHLAHSIYSQDYDDRFVPARYTASAGATSLVDRTWVQLLLPYSADMRLFQNPIDPFVATEMGSFDEDLIPGDVFSRYYNASKRSNLGYNFIFLSPLVQFDNRWHVFTASQSSVQEPESTILFADSAREIVGGRPRGGGNYLIIPPCRFISNQGVIVDGFSLGNISNANIYTGGLSWSGFGDQDTGQVSFGGLFPWFHERVTTMHTDGSIKSRPLSAFTSGCDVKPDWGGLVIDPGAFIWNPQGEGPR